MYALIQKIDDTVAGLGFHGLGFSSLLLPNVVFPLVP